MQKSKINFDILTLFPDFFTDPLESSLLGKAINKGIIEVALHDIRSSAEDKHASVDDKPYGGGEGMVMRVDVLSRALEKVKKNSSGKVILFDPTGVRFDQNLASKLAMERGLILVCGRYEGVDQRFKDLYVDLELSIGDYILAGGELAALVLVETISRLIPGVLGKESSATSESFSLFSTNKGKKVLLEYPQYTKPAIFNGRSVPSILLSGNHEEIRKWRLSQALERTKKSRPDLLT